MNKITYVYKYTCIKIHLRKNTYLTNIRHAQVRVCGCGLGPD